MMKLAVSGSSGLVGSALMPALAAAGHQVARLARPGSRQNRQSSLPDIAWDPGAGRVDAAGLAGLDGVVHLAGENIAAGRWSEKRKEAIRKSRVDGTLLLSRALAGLERPPRVLVSASAIGYYGDRGDEVLRESNPRGHGFLPAVCVAWESATEPAEKAGLRVLHLRFGVILSGRGGALAKMLPPFRFGLGGRVGSGRQFMSWVALDDVVGAIRHALATESLRGPVNVVAPAPVTNLEFTRALGRVLRRPTVAPLPAFAARLMFGEMADALLLASTRVVPDALRASGFGFRYPDLEPALRHVITVRA
jgi:uncharacterized protein (TIGR01777 family)